MGIDAQIKFYMRCFMNDHVEKVEVEIVVVDENTCSERCGFFDDDSRAYPFCILFEYRLTYVDENEDNNCLRCSVCKGK